MARSLTTLKPLFNIRLPLQVRQLCEHFADRRMLGSADVYAFRGEASQQKMREDILVGALAEFAVYEFLKDKVEGLTRPDITIQQAKQKTFRPDLTSPTAKFHVKAQTTRSAQRYGYSWLFQKEDRLLNFPTLDEYFVFCSVAEHSFEVKILGIALVRDIVNLELVGVPKIPKYAYTKKAIYLDDLLKSKLNLSRFAEPDRD